VGNPAGIDLSDGLFDAALGLTDNSEVTVSYLWTGGPALSTVDAGDQQTDTGAASASATGAGTDDSVTGDSEAGGGAGTGDSDAGGGGLSAEQAVAVRSAPAAGAPTVGVAADNAGVPVECATPNGWLRIGTDQYLPASAVNLADDTAVGPC
jgi:hypothetical protein